MWQYIKNFVIDHQSKVVKQIFKKASKNNFRWEMYYFFCSIKNLLPHIQNEYNKKYVQERNTLCTFCARTMFSLSRIDRIIFLCVFKMKKKIWFFEWHSTNIDDDDEVKEKTKRKRRNILYFVHIQLQQSNFTKILSIAIRDTDRPKTTKNQNDKQFYYHFWDSFCQVREIKKIQSREIAEFFLRLLEFLKGFDLRIPHAFGREWIVHKRNITNGIGCGWSKSEDSEDLGGLGFENSKCCSRYILWHCFISLKM